MNILKKLNQLFFLMGAVIFAFINISLLLHFGDINYRGDTRFEFNKILLITIAIVLFLALLLFANFIKNIDLENKAKFLIFAIATILHFIILLIIGNELVDIPDGNWDEGFCFYNALNLLNGASVSDYFIVYPAGIGTFIFDYLIICIGKLLGYTEVIQYSRICIFVSALAIEGTILCSISAVKNICKENQTFIEFLAIVIAYLFIPYYFYPLLFYSDTYSLLFVGIIIKLYTDYCTKKVSKKRKTIYILGIVLSAFIGTKIKATVAIILVAILINELIRKNYKCSGMIISIYFVLTIMFSSFLYAINDTVPTIENDESYKYPYTLYLQFGTEGDYGDYSSEIYNNMIKSINNIGINRTKENQIKEIINTIFSRTISENIDFYTGKANRLWGDGLYLLDVEVIPLGDFNNCFFKNALYQHGIVRSSLYYFAQGFQYILTFLTFLCAVFLCKQNEERALSAFILALIGITAFCVIFWENRSRYLFNMFPLLCVSSAFMINEMIKKIHTHKTRLFTLKARKSLRESSNRKSSNKFRCCQFRKMLI